MNPNRWTVTKEDLPGDTMRLRFQGMQELTFADVIRLLAGDPTFRAFLAQTLADLRLQAFFWEAPPVTDQTLNRPFECVAVNGPPLTRLRPDPAPFSDQFNAHRGTPAIAFPNLGGDALLVAPTPSAELPCYTHLASFLRTAPAGQINAFWQLVGLSMRKRVSRAPLWWSTAGLGVSWLHFRLDSRPKYYRHAPYTIPPAATG